MLPSNVKWTSKMTYTLAGRRIRWNARRPERLVQSGFPSFPCYIRYDRWRANAALL